MIYFVRHGSTDWNEHKNSKGIKDPKCQGRIDLPLNETGIEQAKQTAEAIKGKKFNRIICSPLLRARQTCDIIYNGVGNTPIVIDERIIERNFGEFEGYTRSEFDFMGFWNRNSKQKFKHAESIMEIEKRVFEFLNELKQKPDDDVLIVSHGGVGCIMMSYFKGIPSDGNYLSFEMPHGKPITFDFKELEK